MNKKTLELFLELVPLVEYGWILEIENLSVSHNYSALNFAKPKTIKIEKI